MKRRGRPPGKIYPNRKEFNFGDGDVRLLERLANRMRQSEAGVVRQALVKLAERENIPFEDLLPI